MPKDEKGLAFVGSYIGDDELFDDLEDLKKGQDMVPAIKKAMKRLRIKEEVNEAKRIRPIKGLWTPKQMYTQVARTEKAAFELRQHADFIFQMDADVGPSMSRNSGLYMDVYEPMGDDYSDRPLIIFMFGGAFVGGSRSSGDIVNLCENYASQRNC